MDNEDEINAKISRVISTIIIISYPNHAISFASSSHKEQAPVVQRVDSAIQWINYYPLDNTINFDSTYPLDSDLSNG